jgi:hypothetical protein
MTRGLNLTFLLFLAGLAGCSAAEQPDTAIHVTATLISPTNIQVSWKDTESNVVGHIVEWSTAPQGNYVILAFLWPELTSFVHPDLALQTRCCYRVRPYFGPVSNPVEITTGKALTDEEAKLADTTWAQPKIISTGVADKKFSIRDPVTATKAAPTDLKAVLVHSTSVHFTWTDHASDEEGFMLEIKSGEAPGYRVCAIIDPKINSYGYALTPPETKVSFRVRAYYYGKPSNIAEKTTGTNQTNIQK